MLSKSQKILGFFVNNYCWENNKNPKDNIVAIVEDTTLDFLDGNWIENKNMSKTGIRLIQLADIGKGSFLNKSCRFISEETFSNLNCKEVFTGDILISRLAHPIGRSCIIPSLRDRLITAVDCTIVRLNEKTQNRKYWNYVFNSRNWRKEVEKFAGGSTRKRISRKNLQTIKVPIPIKSEQDEIVRRLSRIEATREVALRKLQIIEQMKNKYINLLFNKL